jgi:cytochrome c-type biogenesis protein CcmH
MKVTLEMAGRRAVLERVSTKLIEPLLVILGFDLRRRLRRMNIGCGANGRIGSGACNDVRRSSSGCAWWLSGMLLVLATCISAHAVTPDEVLPDPKLEMRARAISQVLRCVVCQNQSIDDSNAPLAHDLRVLVRQRLASGDTNEQAVDFIVARYGNFVLLKPPMQFNTLALWLGPALFVLIAAIGFGQYVRRRSADRAAQSPLTSDEQRRVEELLDGRSST